MEIIIDTELDEFTKPENNEEDLNWQFQSLIELIKSTNKKQGDDNNDGRGKVVELDTYENLIPKKATFYHQNMAFYLEDCWNSHAGVVMRPDMFYFTVFNEVAKYVVANAEECRHIFSDKPDKQDITIIQDTNQCINFELLTAALKEKIPTAVHDLLPDFSTDSGLAKEARLACFAEAASPYYNYFTSMCGIKKIRLEGTVDDWASIVRAVEKWHQLLPSQQMKAYLGKVAKISEQILADLRTGSMTRTFWKGIYWQVHCGSGSPKIRGWLCDLYQKEQDDEPYSYRGHVTKVEWTVRDDGRQFVVHHGLFSSTVDDANYAVPSYSRVIFQKKN